MVQTVALRPVAFEDLGLFERLLRARGHAVRYLDVPESPCDPAEAADLLVILGGPIGAYEEDAYPFLSSELRLIERRLSAGLPTLGICLGAQLIARALGARVYPGPEPEIGWKPLSLSPAGMASPLGALVTEGNTTAPVLHWHGDTFDLPSGATLLASTSVCAHQAFALGARVLGLQFHAEVEPTRVESWLVGHTAELRAVRGLSAVRELRSETQRFAPALGHRAERCFSRWLDQAGL